MQSLFENKVSTHNGYTIIYCNKRLTRDLKIQGKSVKKRKLGHAFLSLDGTYILYYWLFEVMSCPSCLLVG